MAINTDVSGADQGRRNIVLYPGPRIVVTSQYIQTADHCYPIRDLLPITRYEVHAHHARNMALIFGAIEVALAAPLAAAYGSAMLLCVGFVAAFGLFAALLVDSRRNPSLMALCAVYRGRPFTLFSSRDRREFGQVRRAVLRAVEANTPARP
ncbi:DUF6232 family protein [Dactylosporangium sp. NBC_01737]|uniref:DUF6232 family protein n=1 Tax=Dactylosporangium sp. NBC_01737 TaxID=2975959 RepID=UPI002E13E46F|nr:DUF6232 family protein [Dactylosporangium sp. NBC_01737]